MRALSGVKRVWSGARAPRERTEPPTPPRHSLVAGGRIGRVAPAPPGTPDDATDPGHAPDDGTAPGYAPDGTPPGTDPAAGDRNH